MSNDPAAGHVVVTLTATAIDQTDLSRLVVEQATQLNPVLVSQKLNRGQRDRGPTRSLLAGGPALIRDRAEQGQQ